MTVQYVSIIMWNTTGERQTINTIATINDTYPLLRLQEESHKHRVVLIKNY